MPKKRRRQIGWARRWRGWDRRCVLRRRQGRQGRRCLTKRHHAQLCIYIHFAFNSNLATIELTKLGAFMRLKFGVAAMFLAAIPASAYAMDADTFYNKAAALQKKGVTAILSSDLKPVMNEIKTASQSVKAENDAAKTAGNPIYCVPKGAKFTSEDALKSFGAIPVARRKSMTVRQAWRETLVKRFPC